MDNKQKDPAVLFYTSDFITGVQGLTMEERGQYITLLCLQHQQGHLSEKTIWLSLGYRSVMEVSQDVLSKFEKDEQGLYFNKRMDIEINNRNNYCLSRKNNGLKGGRPKKTENDEEKDGEQKPYANHMDSICKPYEEPYENHTENEDDNVNNNKIDIRNNIPYSEIQNLYNSICISFSRLTILSDKRKKLIKGRYKSYGIEKIEEVFTITENSDFLKGKNNQSWKANFDWIMNDANFAKIADGNYSKNESISKKREVNLE